MHRLDCRIVWPAFAGLAAVVTGFIGLSLLVNSTGTARFVVAMGCDAKIGYAVGALLELDKDVLPVVVLVLWVGVASIPSRCV